MKPLCVFFHGLLFVGDPPQFLPQALDIITEQMEALHTSGLAEAATEIHVGLNGGKETAELAQLIFPAKAKVVYHGNICRNECRTIRLLEEWLPGHEDWYVLYFHAKGCTAPPGDYLRTRWRRCMMKHLVMNWRRCVRDLELVESVGCHFMCPPRTPPTQFIWAGNFFFSRASYLRTLPSIMLRDRINVSGIDALESRYESEVWHFNGPRMPMIKDYHGPGWTPGQIGTCAP